MKCRKRIVWALFAVFSLLAAASAHAGPLLGPGRSVNIYFTTSDGRPYCDGMRLVIDESTGVVIAQDLGCSRDKYVGTVGALIGRTYHGGAVTLTDAASSCHKVIIDNPQIWIFYNLDGTIRNSGKYAVVMPPIPLVSAHPSDLR